MPGFSVTSIARHPPAAILHTDSSVKEALCIMSEKNVRHAIVSDDGRKMDGIVSAKDILNYLGGGDKFKIVEERFNRDIYKAFGSSISSIINRRPIIGSTAASLPDLM
ncbi:MAG: CBS domain-containing protein, partial [Candidatus Methanomethyliaceae archaeon]|nr:CBS domain-containing protein [Candidatus Methanomethyliaceae archaeon]